MVNSGETAENKPWNLPDILTSLIRNNLTFQIFFVICSAVYLTVFINSEVQSIRMQNYTMVYNTYLPSLFSLLFITSIISFIPMFMEWRMCLITIIYFLYPFVILIFCWTIFYSRRLPSEGWKFKSLLLSAKLREKEKLEEMIKLTQKQYNTNNNLKKNTVGNQYKKNQNKNCEDSLSTLEYEQDIPNEKLKYMNNSISIDEENQKLNSFVQTPFCSDENEQIINGDYLSSITINTKETSKKLSKDENKKLKCRYNANATLNKIFGVDSEKEDGYLLDDFVNNSKDSEEYEYETTDIALKQSTNIFRGNIQENEYTQQKDFNNSNKNNKTKSKTLSSKLINDYKKEIISPNIQSQHLSQSSSVAKEIKSKKINISTINTLSNPSKFLTKNSTQKLNSDSFIRLMNNNDTSDSIKKIYKKNLRENRYATLFYHRICCIPCKSISKNNAVSVFITYLLSAFVFIVFGIATFFCCYLGTIIVKPPKYIDTYNCEIVIFSMWLFLCFFAGYSALISILLGFFSFLFVPLQNAYVIKKKRENAIKLNVRKGFYITNILSGEQQDFSNAIWLQQEKEKAIMKEEVCNNNQNDLINSISEPGKKGTKQRDWAWFIQKNYTVIDETLRTLQ